MGSEEAARALGLTLRTLYRLIDEGRLPAYQPARVIRVRRSDVEAYLAATRIGAGQLGHLYSGGRRDPNDQRRRGRSC